MGFTQWVQRRRIHRFVVQLPFWTVGYLLGNSIAHLLLGWEIRLRAAFIYGTFMAVGFTFWPRGFVRWNGHKNEMRGEEKD